MEFFTYTLPNGIRCIHKRVKSPVAWCAMTVNAGSRDELAGESGIAHFTEHMLFKETGRRKAHHINSRLEKLGGELNAFTTKEETVVHATTLKTDFPKAAELIADILFNSSFPEKEIGKECEVILDEINSCKDSPTERIYDEFEDLFFAGSALGHNILGTRASVGKFTGRYLRRFTARTYNTDQMVFSLAANISEKSFVATAEKCFGHVAPSPRAFERQPPPTVAPFSKTIHRNTYQAHCIMGGRAYSNNDPRRIPLALLVNILGGPAANSRLNTLLREKNALTYNIEASFTPYYDTGVATIYLGTDRDKMDRCRELINELLCEIRNTAMTARQLAAAKKQFTGQLAISMESKESYILSAGKSLLIYNEVDTPEAIYGKIEAVTASDIMNAANEVFGTISTLVYN